MSQPTAEDAAEPTYRVVLRRAELAAFLLGCSRRGRRKGRDFETLSLMSLMSDASSTRYSLYSVAHATPSTV